MTQDEIIEMARQADIRDSLEYDHMECDIESLEAFAKLVAQHEREACAKVCEDLDAWNMDDPASTAAEAIRARSNP
jgi:hypothetical protein